ncbi:MAG: hypothetical protein FWG82_02785 [Oscillospiraceae bacterium]|nr:hypothetical protein [Oscillospiraceae bacterium]
MSRDKLKDALGQVFDEEFAKLERGSGVPTTPSFDQRILKLMRNGGKRVISVRTRRMIFALAAAVGIIFATLFSVSATREGIVSFVVQTYERVEEVVVKRTPKKLQGKSTTTTTAQKPTEKPGTSSVQQENTTNATDKIANNAAIKGNVTVLNLDEDFSGLVVYLFAADDIDDPLQQTTTDENGRYRFTKLAAGRYIVAFEFDEIALALDVENAQNSFVMTEFDGVARSEELELEAGITLDGVSAVMLLLEDVPPHDDEDTTELTTEDVTGEVTQTSTDNVVGELEINDDVRENLVEDDFWDEGA